MILKPTLFLLGIVMCAFAMIVLEGCQVTSPVTKPTTSNVAYQWDAAHELCFAMTASTTYYGYQVVSISYVPLPMGRCR